MTRTTTTPERRVHPTQSLSFRSLFHSSSFSTRQPFPIHTHSRADGPLQVMASASGYNHHRFARALLKKSRRWEASLTVELLPNYWRFEHSVGPFKLQHFAPSRSGPPWTSTLKTDPQPVNFQYNGPMTPFLLALRSQVIPPSLIPFLYDIRPPVSFYDGCLVVQINDLRKTPMAQSRVVMRPAPEALAQTIDVMLERNGIVRDEGLALELESRIIVCLPRFHHIISTPDTPGRDIPAPLPRDLDPPRSQRRARHHAHHPGPSQRLLERVVPQPTGQSRGRRQVRVGGFAQNDARGRKEQHGDGQLSAQMVDPPRQGDYGGAGSCRGRSCTAGTAKPPATARAGARTAGSAGTTGRTGARARARSAGTARTRAGWRGVDQRRRDQAEEE